MFASDSYKPNLLLNGEVFQWESKFKHVWDVLNPSMVYRGTFLYSCSLNTAIRSMEDRCATCI